MHVIKCPHCNEELSVSGDMAGQSVECPVCNEEFVIPVEGNSAPPPVPSKPLGGALTLGDLALPKENTYHLWVLVVSILVWLPLVILIVPIFYGLLIFFGLWFANGCLVAQLRANGVKVDGEQMPEMDKALRDACAKLEIDEVPELYIIESGGLLNAFATRHSGRRFVVVYADLLEAYGPESAEMKFILGHELGHIKRKHIIKQLLLFPGLAMPLLGNAYNRACEASCDRFGAYVAGDLDGAVNAMMVIAGGKKAGHYMNPGAFASQYSKMRGFFVSLCELISGYPTLSQRVANLLAIEKGRLPERAPRHPLAYFLALFSFGGPGTAVANLLVTVAVIGVLSAMVLPAVAQARKKAEVFGCVNNLRQIDAGKMQWEIESGGQQGGALDMAAVNLYIKNGGRLVCPQGGNYTYNSLGIDPECTVHGTMNTAMSRQR